MFFSLILFSVTADTEPNDTFSTAEEVEDGTYYGSVSSPGLGHEDDDDYYQINVPSGWDLRVTLECTGPDSGSQVNVRQYRSFLVEETDGDAIDMDIKYGESEKGEWYNADLSEQEVYLYLVGDGEYTLKIKTVESIDPWVGIGICIAIVIIVVVVIIAIIIVVLRKKKRQAAQRPAYPQTQYPPYGKAQYQYQYQTPTQPQIQTQTQTQTQPQYQQQRATEPPYGKTQDQDQTQTPSGSIQQRTTEPQRQAGHPTYPSPTPQPSAQPGTQFRAGELEETPPPAKLEYFEEKK